MPKQKRARGRPKKNWLEGIRKAMNERNLNEGQWEDRKQWSLGIGQRRTTFWNRHTYTYWRCDAWPPDVKSQKRQNKTTLHLILWDLNKECQRSLNSGSCHTNNVYTNLKPIQQNYDTWYSTYTWLWLTTFIRNTSVTPVEISTRKRYIFRPLNISMKSIRYSFNVSAVLLQFYLIFLITCR